MSRSVSEAEYEQAQAEVGQARLDLLQAEDDLHAALLNADSWEWRDERPCELWPDADIRSVEARQLAIAAEARLNENRDRLEKLDWDFRRLEIAPAEDDDEQVSEPALPA